jgi:hypothetical protein
VSEQRAWLCRKDGSLTGAGFLSKEPQYFSRWPMPPIEEYMHAWHSGVIGDMFAINKKRVLLDASPQYLMTGPAAPRMKAVVPHARFVMVVRVRMPCMQARAGARFCARDCLTASRRGAHACCAGRVGTVMHACAAAAARMLHAWRRTTRTHACGDRPWSL